MARTLEILITGDESTIGTSLLERTWAGAKDAGMVPTVTKKYVGKSDWLCLYGVGDPERHKARVEQVKRGCYAACWDIGYTHRGKDPDRSYLRVSINHNHPLPWMLDRTPSDGSRWDELGIALRNDYAQNGPVIVAGMGPKSRLHLGINDWEVKALKAVQERFPKRLVIYRPKPQGKRDPHINWPLVDGTSPIEELLRGASLAVCRHSNVAVNACIAGIPVECEDGAALWLYKGNPAPDVGRRLDFLRRVAWWQWKTTETGEAWKFLPAVCV